MFTSIKTQNTYLYQDQLQNRTSDLQDSIFECESNSKVKHIDKYRLQDQQNCQANHNFLISQSRPNSNYINEDTDDEASSISQSNISSVQQRNQYQEKNELQDDKQIVLIDDDSQIKINIQNNSQLSQDQSRNELMQCSSNKQFQRKSTLNSKKKLDYIKQRSGNYNIEQAGCVKRRQLFEIGYASSERQAIKKDGLEEEENDLDFTFDIDQITTENKRNNLDDIIYDSSYNNSKSVNKDISEFNDDSMLDSEKIKKESPINNNNNSNNNNIQSRSKNIYNNNNRRSSERLTINFIPRNQKRQKTDNSSQSEQQIPLSILIKQESFDNMTSSRISNTANMYNRNNVFEEDNVKEHSQRRKSKFLANLKLKQSNSPIINGQIELSSPNVDKLNLSFVSSATLQDEIKNIQLGEINTPIASQIAENKNNNNTSDLKWKLVGVAQKFFFNLITTLSYLIEFNEYKLIQWICMLRIFQLPKLIGMVDEHFQLQQKYNTFFELIKLLLLVVLMAHFVGCGFHYCAQSEIQNGSQHTWLNQYQFVNDQVQFRYINSIYFAFITMITVGYGDIVPVSYLEKQYVIVITVISSGLFGYSINTIGAIFQEISKRESDYKQQKYDINIYLSNRQISKKVQLQILKAIEYKNISQASKHLRGEEILQNLSHNIQSEFKKEFFGKILTNCKAFQHNFSQKVRDQFCLYMKEHIFQPGDCIFSENQQNENIYFIYQGAVQIFQEISNERRIIGLAKAGDTLGMFSFFTSYNEQIGAISSDTSYLAYCNKKDFLSVLKQHPRDYENYCRIRDNLTIYKRSTDQACFSCDQRGHEILKCPFYDKRRDSLLTIFRYNIDKPQQRVKKIRSCQQKFNTLSKNKIVRKVLREIRWQCINETDNELHDIDSEAEKEIMNSSDLYFYLVVPQFRWENNQILIVDGGEEDDTFYEYYQQLIEDIDNQMMQESEKSKLQNSNKQAIDNYDAKQPVIECEVETSDSDNENNKQNLNQKGKIASENFNSNTTSQKTIKTEQKESINFDELSSGSTLQLSHQQFLLIRQKAKELQSQLYQKTSSIDSNQKQLNLINKKDQLIYKQTNDSDHKNTTENNLKQQNINLSELNIDSAQNDLINQINSSNSHSNSSYMMVNNTHQNTSSAIIPITNQKKVNTLMSSIIQQKYNQAQQKRGSQDKTLFPNLNQIQQKNFINLSANQGNDQQKLDVWQYSDHIQKIDQLINKNKQIEQINQEHEQFIQLDLDNHREYKSYFPNNNLSNVLKAFLKFQRKIQAKQDLNQKIRKIKGRKNAHKLTLVNLLKKDFQFKSLFSYQNQ
ncbi:hypothetical protein ABPG73_015583 [Tetrahymena malaccensis]